MIITRILKSMQTQSVMSIRNTRSSIHSLSWNRDMSSHLDPSPANFSVYQQVTVFSWQLLQQNLWCPMFTVVCCVVSFGADAVYDLQTWSHYVIKDFCTYGLLVNDAVVKYVENWVTFAVYNETSGMTPFMQTSAATYCSGVVHWLVAVNANLLHLLRSWSSYSVFSDMNCTLLMNMLTSRQR